MRRIRDIEVTLRQADIGKETKKEPMDIYGIKAICGEKKFVCEMMVKHFTALEPQTVRQILNELLHNFSKIGAIYQRDEKSTDPVRRLYELGYFPRKADTKGPTEFENMEALEHNARSIDITRGRDKILFRFGNMFIPVDKNVICALADIIRERGEEND